MPQDRKLRMGILGVGSIAQIAHLPALSKAHNIELLAACDSAKDLLEKMARRYDIPRAYTSSEQFWADKDIEAVLIPVSDPLHAPLTISSLRAGKHVLVEKPLAETVEDAEKMVAAAKETGRQLQIGCMKRFDPALEVAQKFVVEKLGRPLQVSGFYCDSKFHGEYVQALAMPIEGSNAQVRPHLSRGRMLGNLLGHGVHAIDLLQFFGGPITAVTSRGNDRGFGLSSLSILEYASGATGTYSLVNAAQMDWLEGLHIHGEFGSVVARINFPYMKRCAEVQMFDTHTNQYSSPTSSDLDQYERQAEAFADAILNGRPVSPSGEDGLAAQRVLAAIYESQNNDGVRVEVPR